MIRIFHFKFILEVILSPFLMDIEKVVENFGSKWKNRNEDNNFCQTFDAELVKEELRPTVFEEIQKQVDSEVVVMLQNLRA